MPFLISGNIDRISPEALSKFKKNFGLILSENQFTKQQYLMIQSALKARHDYVHVLSRLQKHELLSLIFLISQFGDCMLSEIPAEYSYFENIPYIVEWTKGAFTIPYEILDFLSGEKIFKEQQYLFALLPAIPAKEKKAWVKWMNLDFEGESEKELNYAIYANCRILQQPYKGKSYIHETEFLIEQLWPPGKNEIVDWYYKGMTTFYFAMQELSRTEKDPFFSRVLEEIKSGKYLLKKISQRFGESEKYKLISTVEGRTAQLRNTVFNWELERKTDTDFLFQSI